MLVIAKKPSQVLAEEANVHESARVFAKTGSDRTSHQVVQQVHHTPT